MTQRVEFSVMTFQTSFAVSLALDGVMSFSRIKYIGQNVFQSIELAGFLLTMAEGWENLKEATAFSTSFSLLESKQISHSS